MKARTEEPRHTLSINLPISLYQKLVDEAGKGKIGIFIKNVLEKELSEKEGDLINEYQECYSNPQMIKEAKQWEKAEIQSWLKYEKKRAKKSN